jgi:hypothetical protein
VAAASCATLKEMNPMVTINTAPGPVASMTDAALAEFHVVVMGGGSLRHQAALDDRCRKLSALPAGTRRLSYTLVSRRRVLELSSFRFNRPQR